jgi:ribosome maturation factor RimP
MTASNDAIERAIAPIVASRGLAVYDIELSGSGRARVLRITISANDAASDSGLVSDARSAGTARSASVDVDALAELARALDPVVDDLIDGSFQLEVSSPGLERTLRRPEHFAGAQGQRVSVKFTSATDGVVRELGQLVGFDGHDVELLDDNGAIHTIAITAISSARTMFEWGPTPRPGKGTKPGAAKHTTTRAARQSATERA